MNLDTITAQFYTAGVNYSAAIQPYALKLFFALLLIDLIITWMQYTAEGQVDPSFFLGRLLKQVLSGGFIYMMIVNGFSWMYLVIQSFSRIGSAISGLPALSPQSVLQTGLSMANTLFEVPATSGVLSTLELALASWTMAIVVAAAFIIVAIDLMLMLCKAYLITGLGVMLLGFGGNRFTASASEGYFTAVIRIGTRLLFYYAVLAVGMNIVATWQTALTAACKPVSATVPFVTSYYVAPTSIVTTVCSGSISLSGMLDFAALSAVFAALSVAVPSMAADLVGGTIGLALAHAFEAAYTAQTITRIVNPITASLKKVHEGVSAMASGKPAPEQRQHAAMHGLLAEARQSQTSDAAASRATTALDPFTGKPDPHPEQPHNPPQTRSLPLARATTPISSLNRNGNGNRSV